MKISSRDQLEKYLAELAKVSVADAIRSNKADSEKQYQSSVEKRVKSVSASGGGRRDTSEDEAPEPELKGTGGRPVRGDPAPEDEPEETELDIDDPNAGDEDDEFTPDDITVDAIVDKLNSIRSGRSTKDHDIIQKMDDYVRTLDDPDRVKLYGYLKNINNIVAVDQAAAGGNVKKPDSEKEPEEPEAQKMARVKDLEKRRELKKSATDSDTQAADRAVERQPEGGAAEPSQTKRPQPPPEQHAKAAPRDAPKKKEKEDRTPPIRVGVRSKGTSI